MWHHPFVALKPQSSYARVPIGSHNQQVNKLSFVLIEEGQKKKASDVIGPICAAQPGCDL